MEEWTYEPPVDLDKSWSDRLRDLHRAFPAAAAD